VKAGDFNLSQRGRSFAHALRGLGYLVRTQPHARLHLIATTGVIVAGMVLEVSRGEWLLLVLAIGLVWMAEALNTALEALADAVHPEHHPLVGRAKDVAAAGVLLSAMAAAIVGLWIFLPRL
jgi:diacylglycerol kinase